MTEEFTHSMFKRKSWIQVIINDQNTDIVQIHSPVDRLKGRSFSLITFYLAPVFVDAKLLKEKL